MNTPGTVNVKSEDWPLSLALRAHPLRRRYSNKYKIAIIVADTMIIVSFDDVTDVDTVVVRNLCEAAFLENLGDWIADNVQCKWAVRQHCDHKNAYELSFADDTVFAAFKLWF